MDVSEPDRAHVRLAELVAALSLGIDLGFGQPMEHILRQCLIAMRIAERLDFPDETRVEIYYAALLVNVGCHTDAHEQAKWFGDDVALKATKYDDDPRAPIRSAVSGMRMLGAGNTPLHRLRIAFDFAVSGHREVDAMITQHAQIARRLGEELGLPLGVLVALEGAYERWDGKGYPGRLKGEDVPIASRVAQLAEFVEVAHRTGGVAAARALASERSGIQFDPQLADLLIEDADVLLDGLDDATWDTVISSEPALARVVAGEDFDAALTAIADFADLKSPYLLGHSRAVSALLAEAAAQLGLPESEHRLLRRAGLVHDFGRLGISNAIWDKRGPLGAGEWERVRMYPYLTQRMLRQSEALAPLGAIAGQHRERPDGSGYPSGLTGPAISRHAKLLAAADTYQAMLEPRPHRPSLAPDAAAAELRRMVKDAHLDGEAADAILRAVGHRVPRRREGPAGLTPREVEVLRLLAQGLSNKEIAERLVISPKTAGKHVEHIYLKIDASSRATASLFAVQHGLLPA